MNLIRYLLVAILAIVLTACGGGGGSAGNPGGIAPTSPVLTPLFTTAPANLTTAVGAAQEFSISDGTAPYTAVSDNATIATASVNGSKLTIGGVASGTAGVSVRDARGASVPISVTVRSATLRNLFTTAASKLVVSIGSASAQTYVVGGGTAPYTVTSSNAGVVSAALTGNNMTLTGLSVGTANILVSDNTGASVTLEVTVQPASVLFTTAAGGVTVAVGTSPVYSVGGGTGPYTASSSNTSVATTSLSGGALTINGAAAGAANIVVRDSAGATTTIAVTVPAANSTPLFTTAPADVTLAVGTSVAYIVGGGAVGPYTATSSNTGVVAVSILGNTLTVTGLAPTTTSSVTSSGATSISFNPATVVVRDTAGSSTFINVTVGGAGTLPLFTTAPASITVAIGATPQYTVGGGANPYAVTSSNTSVATVSILGSTLTVTGIAVGSADIVIRDSAGASTKVVATIQPAGNLALFTTAPASGVTVALGTSSTYNVGGGSGSGYLATSTNTGVVTVNLTGTNLTVTGAAVGKADVVVRDSAGGLVTVNVSVGAIPVAVTPSSATGIIDDILIATVTGGTPPYRASPGNILVAFATIENSNVLRIKLLQAGQTIVTVLDANNQSVAYSVTSNAATPGIRLSPGAVTISEFDSQPILFTVFGAKGNVNVFSSDVTRLTAAIDADNRAVTVTTGTSGNRCVPADLVVTLTVVDSTRASGTALVTIKDNVGVTCPAP